MRVRLVIGCSVVGVFLGCWTLHRAGPGAIAIQEPMQIQDVSLVPLQEDQLIANASSEEALPSMAHPVQEGPPSKKPLFDPNAMEKDCGVWIQAEALFWQAHVDGLSYGTESKSTTTIRDGRVKRPDFDWKGGYRLGLGYKIPHDKWDLFANYTYLYGSADGSSNQTIFPVWATNFAKVSPFYADGAKTKWQMHLNMGDLELGRNCMVGKWLSLRPFFGVRGGTIQQRYNVEYKGGTVAPGDTDKLDLNTDFWGVGLRMGLNSLWGLGGGFSLYGNGSTSFLSGHFDVHEREKLLKSMLKKMHIDSRVDNVVVEADVALGLQWDYLFSRDRYHFGVKLGWEFDIYFGQNRLFSFSSTSPGSARFRDEDLSFQGLTMGFRFDF